MPTVITGTDGINQVQAGAVESGDLPAGSVIQVVSTFKDSLFSASITGASTSTSVTGLSASITPVSSNNKILVTLSMFAAAADATYPGLVFARLTRNGSQLQAQANDSDKIKGPDFRNVDNGSNTLIYFSFLDSPQSTSQQTYQVQVGQNVSNNSFTVYVNGSHDGANIGASSITAMEIAG